MFDELNKEKAKYEKGIILGIGISIIAFILFIPIGTLFGPLVIFPVGIPFLGGVLFAGKMSKKVKGISNEFKQKYVTKELLKVFPDSKYRYDYGFSQDEVIASKLLHKQDRYYSEDLIYGSFDGVKFCCSDVKQQDVRSNGKSTTVVTVFQGRFYEFDFPKEFMYNLLLIQPFNFRPFESYNKIKMESIQFNSELKVYAKNDHEAFYILTPHFMEQLLVLDRKYNDKISFSFINSKLYIAIDSRKDYFDIKPFKPISKSLIEEYKNEFDEIKDFILTLRLNRTLFKKHK